MYPTVLVHPEAVHGMELPTGRILSQGARLLNRHGEEFYGRWESGSTGEATRDVLSRAIAKEIAAGGGSESGGVYLDARGIPEGLERDRYNKYLLDLGINLSASPQQVAPGAHYSLGGIKISPSTACNGLEGVFAGGEVVGGVHGANRLAGNALTETQVFGNLAGQAATDYLGEKPSSPAARSTLAAEPDHRPLERGESVLWDAICEARLRPSGVAVERVREQVRGVMQRHASVIRTDQGLREGLAEIGRLREVFHTWLSLPSSGTSWHSELLGAVEAANMLDAAKTILASALARTESRGAHFRQDYPERQDGWDGCNLLAKGAGDSMALYRCRRESGEREQIWQ